nr:hypothetical protein [Tanacetum cinerariifolium]GEZ00700.1 hypothetical protein [Tanacetum cinerariifolium]
MPHEDDVLPAEVQPLPAAVSPATDSLGYITESDPEEDPEEEDDEDSKDDPADYPIDRNDDDDKEEEATMIRLRAESSSTSHLLPLPPPMLLSRTRASMVMMRTGAPSTYILAPRSETPPSGTPPLLPIPLPTSSPPLLLPFTDCKVDVPEVTLPPRKRLCIAIGPRFEMPRLDVTHIERESYKITDVWEDPDEIAEEIPMADVAELSQRMTYFVTTLNSLRRDRRSYARTSRLMESEARASREAWVQSMDARVTTRSEVRALQTMVLAQEIEIRDLRASQQRPARDPAHPDVPEEAGSRRAERTTRGCTYTDCFKSQPMNFKGTEGAVGLTQWFERMETVFKISNCAELALMCGRMFPKESDKIEKYVGGLPNMIHGSVMASKPKKTQDAVEFATELMDKKIRTFAEWITLLGLVIKNLTEDLNLCAPNATITMMVRVLPNATSATELAIWPVTGHFKKECPKLKTNNRGNQGGNGNALAKVYVVGNSRSDPTLLNNSEMAAEGNGDLPVPDLRTMEELCQPSLNGRGGIKVNGVTDDALRLYLFPYSLTHHANAWFDRLPRSSINTFAQMAKMFLGKYFPPSMVIKLRNEITNFRQHLDESLFEAWERYKLSIDRCSNHNMFPATQIDTFYNGLTLRHRDTINAAAGGTFMKRHPEECYDLTENMTAHHNNWDTSAQWSESSSSITSFFDTEITSLKAEMAEINKNLIRVL